MRLWTIHPKYLDPRGLVALWREALLAQAVLTGRTRGYVNHPQLTPFRDTPSPVASIASYLVGIHAEAGRRGYRFDATKIFPAQPVELIEVTRGQLDYEWAHLLKKLRVRAPSRLAGMRLVSLPDSHTLFRVIPGPAASWEMVRPHNLLHAPASLSGKA